jgi:ketosteroid isomerase-like protein
MDTRDKRDSVVRFATAVRNADRHALATAVATDVVWTIPGDSLISGKHVGPTAVHALATTLADHHYEISLQALTFGTVTVAVEIRGTGTHNGREIDVAVVNVLRLKGDLISNIDTHFSNLEAVSTYFGPPYSRST